MTSPDLGPGAGSLAGPGVNVNAVDRTLLVSYGDYASAQRAVDYLSDKEFPVEHTSIIGSDLRLVEQVTGRVTLARAAAAGAASGAWFGLFIGLLLGLFTDRTFLGWLGLVLVAILVGAAWGALFGLVAHAVTGGRRDFASRSGIIAGRYDVMVAGAYASQARAVLETLT